MAVVEREIEGAVYVASRANPLRGVQIQDGLQIVAGQLDLAPSIRKSTSFVHQVESQCQRCQHGVVHLDFHGCQTASVLVQHALTVPDQTVRRFSEFFVRKLWRRHECRGVGSQSIRISKQRFGGLYEFGDALQLAAFSNCCVDRLS